MHDFRIIQTDNKNKLLFDLEIPFSITEEERENILHKIKRAIQSEHPTLKRLSELITNSSFKDTYITKENNMLKLKKKGAFKTIPPLL